MPLVEVTIAEGRSAHQIRAMIHEVHDAVLRVAVAVQVGRLLRRLGHEGRDPRASRDHRVGGGPPPPSPRRGREGGQQPYVAACF